MTALLPSVLLVDDEIELLVPLGAYLERRGLKITLASQPVEAREKAAAAPPDLVVLDLQLGREDGFSVARWLLSELEPVPSILFFSGDPGLVHRVLGLEAGADDFLQKPASPREVLARIRAILRRRGWPEERLRLIPINGIAVDLQAQTVVLPDGQEELLSPGEVAVLRLFLTAPHRAFTREEILEAAPASDRDVSDRSVDFRIARLRTKLRDSEERPAIETLRGVGYRLARWVTAGLS